MSDEDLFRVVSVSGGKDSTATYLWALEQGFDFQAVFADTGNEHPVTVNYVRNMHVFCKGPKVEIVEECFADRLEKKGLKATSNPFLDMMLWKGRAPSARAQFCTEATKLAPIRKWLMEARGENGSVVYVGIRKAESLKRSKLPREELNEYQDSLLIRPILDWSEEDVFAMMKKHGVEPNPLYGLGYKRVGCFPCIHARKIELALLPGWAWEKVIDWEEQLGGTWFSYGTIPLTDAQKLEFSKIPRTILQDEKGADYYGQDPEKIKELKNRFSPKAPEIREWAKTSRGGKQFDFFAVDEKDAPTCMNTWGHCE